VTQSTKIPTVRILDLNARRTIRTGVPLWQAQNLIDAWRRENPAARFDLRSEVAS
jgi:hypothetical protein